MVVSHAELPAVRRGRVRRLTAPVATTAAVAAYALVVHLVDPNQAGHYPTCPWLLLTGTYCPGCGSLRATHALTDGDVGLALQRNPLLVLGAAVGAVLLVRWFGRRWRGVGPGRAPSKAILFGMVIGLWAFWIARNIPGATWLSPA